MALRVIVLADASALRRERLASMVAAAGFSVREAANLPDALVLLHLHPDAIILDRDLPELDPHEFCARLGQDPALARTRVILKTMEVSDAERQRLIETTGVAAVLDEPIQRTALVSTLASLLPERAP